MYPAPLIAAPCLLKRHSEPCSELNDLRFIHIHERRSDVKVRVCGREPFGGLKRLDELLPAVGVNAPVRMMSAEKDVVSAYAHCVSDGDCEEDSVPVGDYRGFKRIVMLGCLRYFGYIDICVCQRRARQELPELGEVDYSMRDTECVRYLQGGVDSFVLLSVIKGNAVDVEPFFDRAIEKRRAVDTAREYDYSLIIHTLNTICLCLREQENRGNREPNA